MEMIDPINSPSGRELVTQRDVWKIRDDDGEIFWAYIQEHQGTLYVTGYPTYQVQQVDTSSQTGARVIVGATTGALVGRVFGPAGIIIGGILGAMLFAGSNKE